MRLVYLCLLAALFVPACLAAYPCEVSLGGKKWDFTPLSKNEFVGKDTSIDYTFNVKMCGVSASSTDCTSRGGSVCAYSNMGALMGAIGKFDGDPQASWSLIDNGAPGQGVQLTFTNGDNVLFNKQTTVIKMTCDPAVEPSATTFLDVQTSNGSPRTFTITFPSKYGCPSSGGGSGGKKGGLSGGWVFIIILLVTSFVYVVGGCVYKRRVQGTTGRESCPNVAFWMAIPGLVKDGCRFTWSKIRGTNAQGYDNV